LTLPALIVGETGVGKEVVARSIHEASPRRHKPWVPVNMAAIPESLAAAELFGAAAGAYTGARFAREGAFQRADGSTLFLDEIGDTPPLLQTQLLRALQQGEVQIVGGKPLQVDIRVISATDVPIHAAAGFRRALLERLSGITIAIAPLRERREDIGVLVLHRLVSSLPEVYADLSHRWLTDTHLAAHWAHALFHWSLADWPGNVRELGMAVSRLASADQALVAPQERALHDNRLKGLYDYDENELLKIHEVHGYEMAATARALGVSRQRLYRRIADFEGWRTIDKIDDQELLDAIDKHGPDVRVLHQVLRVPIRNLKRRLSDIVQTEG
jgi:two-component system nitrogen regulation response regulator GlnG